MKLHSLLKHRLEIAKSFTKEFHEEIDKCILDYECKLEETEKLERLTNVNKRYEFKIPYIFATHESMLSTMFDKTPDIVFKGRGKLDADKAKKVEAIYNYLVDVLDLEGFMLKGAWWFILTGFVSSHIDFRSEYQEVPVLDEFGEPVVNELGEPEMRAEYTFNDPVATIDDPKLVYFSPESKFTEKGDKVPYLISEAMMEVEEIKATYGKKVEPDSEVSVNGIDKDKVKDDLKRVKTYFYCGTLPEDAEGVKDWEYGKQYYVVFTEKEVLFKEKLERNKFKLGKWHGSPNSFFGFGIGNRLRTFQKELSIRRGQQIRYADVAAFPKIGLEQDTDIDEKALLDPREQVVLLYRDKPPVYLTAPDLSNTLIATEQKAREDAQFVSGLLDMSKGAQESTVVKTATGQSIFAEMGEKRIKQAKRQFTKFYRAVVIELFELCKENWDEEKVISITDDKGQDIEMPVTGNDLADIDFEKDLDFDFENSSINKEVLRAQTIELYDRFKEDPNVDQNKLRDFVLREGFNQKNPEVFSLSEEERMMQAGGQMGMQGQMQVPNQNVGL